MFCFSGVPAPRAMRLRRVKSVFRRYRENQPVYYMLDLSKFLRYSPYVYVKINYYTGKKDKKKKSVKAINKKM